MDNEYKNIICTSVEKEQRIVHLDNGDECVDTYVRSKSYCRDGEIVIGDWLLASRVVYENVKLNWWQRLLVKLGL